MYVLRFLHIAGTNTETQTDKEAITTEDTTTEDKTTDDANTSEVVRPPSPPRDLPQHHTRITLAQVFLLGLHDNNVIKIERCGNSRLAIHVTIPV